MAWATVRFVSLLFFIGSISAAKVPRIIGGENTVIKSFPFIVSLRYAHDRDFFCAGAIISERHILTAAHCVKYKDVENFEIYSGVTNIDEVGDVHKVISKTVHPTYRQRDEITGSDDIAVLTLEKPIVFNKYQKKIELPTHDVEDYAVGYAIGWGRTSRTNYWETATQLQKLRVSLIPSEKCKPFLETKIDKTQLCTLRTTGKAACHGDSGGPLVSHGVVVGIVSRGDTAQCADGSPNIFTNVFAFKDFIKSAMEK